MITTYHPGYVCGVFEQYDHTKDGRSFKLVGGDHPGNYSPNLGSFDAGVYLSATLVKDGEDAYKHNAFNQKASDEIAIDRTVPDTRAHRYCDTCIGFPLCGALY